MLRSPLFWIFIWVLVSLHAYIGFSLIPDLPVNAFFKGLATLFLLSGCVLIPFGLLPIRIRKPSLAEAVTWAGLLFMGFESSLLILTLLRDLFLLVKENLSPESVNTAEQILSQQSAIGVIAAAALMTLIGFFNARRIAKVVHVDVPIKDLPDELHGFTIAQISDIHVGPTIKQGYIDAIVDKVNQLNPHVIAVTGDLVDGSVKKLARHTLPLSRLQATYGSYFVTGNHEYYSGAHSWISEFRSLGLRVLLNEHELIHHEGCSVLIAGVTDYTAHHFDPQHRSCPHTALQGAPEKAGVKVLLAHQPRSASAAADAGFDLQFPSR